MKRPRGRAGYVDFIGVPRKVADSIAFRTLPALARALYFDLRRQHTGFNNGQIAAVLQGTQERPGLAAYGWPPRSVYKFLRALLEHGLIEKTRQGGVASMSKTCSLYAFTDLPVVAHKEKGIAGRMPSLAYLQFAADSGPEKRIVAAHHASIHAHGARTHMHLVPTEPSIDARGAANKSSEKVT